MSLKQGDWNIQIQYTQNYDNTLFVLFWLSPYKNLKKKPPRRGNITLKNLVMANISSLPEIAMYNAIVRRVKTISNSVKTEAAN